MFKLKNFLDLLKLLDKKDWHQIIKVLLFSLVSSIVELMSIALIIPLVYAISNLEKIKNHPLLSYLYLIYIPDTDSDLILIVVTTFSLFIIISGILRYFLLNYQTLVTYKIGSVISNKVYHKMINSTYSFYSSTSQSDIIVTFTSRMNNLILKGFYSAIKILSSLVSLAFIITGLLIFSPYIVFIVFAILLGLYITTDFIVKNHLKKDGQIINEISTKITNLIRESWVGYKEILIESLQEHFQESYNKLDLPYRLKLAKVQILSMKPRILIETFAYVSLGFIAIYIVLQKNMDILPTIGFLSIAIQKTIPNIQSIFQSVASIRSSDANFKSINLILNAPQIEMLISPSCQKKPSIFDIVRLKNISFEYPNNKKILANIDLTITSGEWILITGQSGEGKSTLMDLIMGFETPSMGAIEINNLEMSKYTLNRWWQNIAHISQEIHIYSRSIRDNITLNDKFIDENFLELCIRSSMLSDLVKNLHEGLNTIIGEKGINLSGGELQRLAMARALYRRKQILFMDEATAGLDSKTEKKVLENIKLNFKNITLVAISHNKNINFFFNKIYKLEHHKLIQINK